MKIEILDKGNKPSSKFVAVLEKYENNMNEFIVEDLKKLKINIVNIKRVYQKSEQNKLYAETTFYLEMQFENIVTEISISVTLDYVVGQGKHAIMLYFYTSRRDLPQILASRFNSKFGTSISNMIHSDFGQKHDLTFEEFYGFIGKNLEDLYVLLDEYNKEQEIKSLFFQD